MPGHGISRQSIAYATIVFSLRRLDWDEKTNLSTPTHAQTRPFLHPCILVPQLLDQFRYLFGGIRRTGRTGEEIAQLLLLLFVVGREDARMDGFAVEEIGHEDLVLVVLVGVGEDIGALEGLGTEAEDVIDDEDGGGGGGGTGGVWVSCQKEGGVWREGGDCIVQTCMPSRSM